jgi:hypothetical protein
MNAQDILKYLEKQGLKPAPPDDPIYRQGATIRFINHSGTTAPKKRKESDGEK